MAPIQVPSYANIKLWWEKFNELGIVVGDLNLLDPRIDPFYGGVTDPNLVAAMNSLFAAFSGDDRLNLARAIAMS